MLSTIGARRTPEGLVDLLLECHQRIRHFTQLAERIGQESALPDAERRDACARCRHYFVEALPLHVADEEHGLLPRLRGRDAALDAALTAMHLEHEQHEPLLARLLDLLDRVAAAPQDPALRETLASAAARLATALAHHLAQEEDVIFPKVNEWMSLTDQDAVIAELRARR